MRWLACLVAVTVTACTPAQVEVRKDPPPVAVGVSPDAEVRAVIERFLHAATGRDFKAAYALLSAPLRSRYTPERLAADFDQEPLAKERLSRIEAALHRPIVVTQARASLALGPSRALKLVHEDGSWRITALE